MTNFIIVPNVVLSEPVVDRTELQDGRVIYFLALEGKPLWVSGILFATLLKGIKGWIAYECPPHKRDDNPKKHGLFFPKRIYAINCAERAITSLAHQLFPQFF